MTATPITTKLGPDRARLEELMRSLAESTSTDAPILSVYVDVRPRQASLTDAHVEIVRDHAELARHDGVGATLRFRI